MALIDPKTRDDIAGAFARKDKALFQRTDFIRRMPSGDQIKGFKRTLGPAEQKEFNGRLLESVKKKDRDGAIIAIRNGAEMEAKDASGKTPLILATEAGDVGIVRLLMNNGADVDACAGSFLSGRFPFSPLMVAADKGNIEVAGVLLENADVDLKSPKGQLTALMVAALMGEDDMVRFLIDNNADPDLVEEESQSAVYLAARQGRTGCLRVLLEQGANPHNCDKKKQTPLMEAVDSGNIESIELLIKHAANTNAEDADGNTALSRTDNFGIIGLLVAAGADINHPNKKGMTPLFTACSQGNAERVQSLLAIGAKPDIDNPKGSALMVCLGSGAADTGKIAGMLLEKGADANARDENMETPLMKAIGLEDVSVYGTLLGKGADPAAQDKDGESAWMKAAKQDIKGIPLLVALLALGKDRANAVLSMRDKNGWTAVTHAAASGSMFSTICSDDGTPPTMAGLLLSIDTKSGLERIADNNGDTPLMVAVRNRKPEAAASIVTFMGRRVDDTNKKGETALALAASCNDTGCITMLLDNGADVNHPDQTRSTPLMHAEHGDSAAILIKRGARIDAMDAEGRTALMRAAAGGKMSVVDKLLSARADVHLCSGPGHNGPNALMLAAANANSDIVALLLENGARPGWTDGRNWTALMYAAERGDPHSIRVLRHKMNQDGIRYASRHDGLTALDVAAKNGHADAIQALIGAGADVNRANANDNKKTPLFYAAESGEAEAVNVLLTRGTKPANIEQRDGDCRTALMHAIECGKAASARKLVELGADVNAVSAEVNVQKELTSVLALAAEHGDLEVAKLLLEKGAKVDVRIGYQQTALMKAAEKGKCDVVTLLRGYGANANARDLCGNTPLMKAAAEGHDEAVVALLSKSPGPKRSRPARINARNDSNETALMLAAQKGHTKIVEALAKHGAKVHARKGRTASEMAKTWAARVTGPFSQYAAFMGLIGSGLGILIDVAGMAHDWYKYGFTNMLRSMLPSNDKGFVGGLMVIATGLAVVGVAGLIDKANRRVWRNIAENGANGETAVMMAAAKGHTETVELLLSQPGKPYRKATDGTTLLMSAARGNAKTLEKVLEYASTHQLGWFSARNKAGWNTAMHAAASGNRECFEYLMERKRQDEIMLGGCGFTAHDYVDIGTSGSAAERATVGLTRLARVALPSSWVSGTSLAESEGHMLMRDLLEMAGDYGLEYEKGIRLLVDNGVNPNMRTWSGRTPLAYALGIRNEGIARWLIEKGARIEPAYMDHAAEEGQLNFIRLLVEKGARVRYETWEKAMGKGRTEVAAFLYGKWNDGAKK